MCLKTENKKLQKKEEEEETTLHINMVRIGVEYKKERCKCST